MSDVYSSMPKQVRVGFFYYSISTINDELANEKGVFGYVDNTKNEIKVSDGLNEQQLLNTVMHEILHAIHWVHNLTDKSTEEEFTVATANGLCAFYADNPDFVEWFFALEDADEKPLSTTAQIVSTNIAPAPAPAPAPLNMPQTLYADVSQ